MTVEHKKSIQRNRCEFEDNMNINAMMSLCISQDVLDNWDIDEVDSKKTRREKIGCFLDALQRRPDICYSKFIDILKRTKQNHLAELLELSDSPDMLSTPDEFSTGVMEKAKKYRQQGNIVSEAQFCNKNGETVFIVKMIKDREQITVTELNQKVSYHHLLSSFVFV